MMEALLTLPVRGNKTDPRGRVIGITLEEGLEEDQSKKRALEKTSVEKEESTDPIRLL